ncbi:unnamed protein product [Phytophthora fragariaefolia]|uniref:Unnamed protein product n=1 Tax=Phytophthora fragariaefolia TaxID=1490495 RepID=A0A9W6XDT9_9STRA|nr:unnamed protein product [Phytophthora fragariaefolia]
MKLNELKPSNSKRAKDTAISAFMAFVRYEHVEFDYVKQCIEQDATVLAELAANAESEGDQDDEDDDYVDDAEEMANDDAEYERAISPSVTPRRKTYEKAKGARSFQSRLRKLRSHRSDDESEKMMRAAKKMRRIHITNVANASRYVIAPDVLVLVSSSIVCYFVSVMKLHLPGSAAHDESKDAEEAAAEEEDAEASHAVDDNNDADDAEAEEEDEENSKEGKQTAA